VSRSLPWPFNPRPLANALEIFKHNRPLRAFGFGNQTLANSVVCVLLKAALATCKSFQVALGRLGADLLERLPATLIPLAAALNRLTRKRFAVAVGCQVDDTQIDTQETFRVERLRRFNLSSGEQIPLASHECQIGFAALRGKQLALTVATNEGDRQPPVKCPNRNLGTFEVVGEDTVIVGNCAVWLECALGLAIELVGIRNLGDAAYRQLCRQAKRFTRGLIGQFVDGELPKGVCLPCELADKVAGSVGGLKRAPERVGLFGRRKQLYGSGQPHNMIVYHNPNVCASAALVQCAETPRGATRLLPGLKHLGFRLVRFL
jgi:hypothetical protein